MSKSSRKKELSLTLRGFNVSPEEIETMLGRKGSRTGQKGLPVRPGVSAILNRSFVRFSVDLSESTGFSDAIAELFEKAGGFSVVERVCQLVGPEFVEVNLYLPVRESEEQEGGVIDRETIKILARLGCSISLEL